MIRRAVPASFALLTLLAARAPGPAAQTVPLAVRWPGSDETPREAILGLDHDDDDDNGVPDLADTVIDPNVDDDVTLVEVRADGAGGARAVVTGGVRIVGLRGLATEAVVPLSQGRAVVAVVGVEASARARDASLAITVGSQRVDIPLTVVGVGFLRGDHARLRGHRDALAVSHQVTTDATLPREESPTHPSPDLDNTRVEVWDPGATRSRALLVASQGTAASLGAAAGAVRGQLRDVLLLGDGAAAPMRSTWVRLVGDEVDLRAPGVQSQTLLVGLRDRVRATYTREGAAGSARTDLRVGRPGNEDGPLAARRARWNLHVLRDRPAAQGGRPVVGDDDAAAERIARRQVTISNEIYLQCLITFGDPAQATVRIEDPPPPTMVSIADRDGLNAAGGVIRLRVNGRALPPVPQRRGATPVDTALRLAEAVRAAGFSARVSTNPRVDFGAAGSVEVIVRDAAGRMVTLGAPLDGPLSTDPSQRVALGVVDLSDGVEEFNNLTSATGTLEERSLVKSLQDNDPGTIDLFVVNRFARGTRIGEAFVSGDRGTLINALLLDRAGIATEREAWTQSHEAGHILLDQPWHPDNMGPDRPWLLMDADASLGAVVGPKRLTSEECARIRDESGVASRRPALQRYDLVTRDPYADRYDAWPERPLWPTLAPEAASSAAPREPAPPAQRHGLRWLD
ncbi:MAG: hypothetical protein R3A48_09725 [Polyangiales bacterium]